MSKSENNKETKLIKNSALLMMGNFSSKLLVLFLVPFYTSVLSTEDYGVSDLVITTVNLLYPIMSLMVETAVLRFCLDKGTDRKSVFSFALWVETVGFIVLVPISYIVFPLTPLADYLFLFMAYYASHTLYMLLMNYVKGIEKVSVYAFASVCNTMILILCNLLFLLHFRMGVQGYLLSMIIGYGSTSLVLFFCGKVNRVLGFPQSVDKTVAREMIKYSSPLIPNSISWWVNNSSDRYILTFFSNLGEVGIYTASYKIPSILTTVSNILINAWELSAVDEFGTEKNRLFFSKMYKAYLDFLMVGATAILIMLKPIAFLAYKKEFFTAWMFVPALLFASVVNTLNNFVGTIFTAAKKTNSIFVTTLIGAIVNIGMNFLLIPFWGAQGAAIATAMSYLVVYILRMYKSFSIMRLEIDMKENVVKLTIIGILSIIACVNVYLTIIVGIIILWWERKFIVAFLGFIMAKIKRKKKREA